MTWAPICAGELQPGWVEVAGYDQRGAGRPGDSHREAPDGAAAEDQYGAAGNLGLENRVDCVAQRIHDRADLGGDAVELDDVGRRHDDEIGERAIPIHSDDLGPPAEVAVAQAALQAVSADDMALGGNEIAHREQVVLRRFLAQLGDAARKLMADDDRRLKPVAGPAVPLPDVKVGSTDTGVMNLDQRLSRSTGGNRHVAENNAGTGGLFDQGAHGGGI